MSGGTPVRGRLLLYLDILGFRELTKSGNAEDVYNTLNMCLRQFQNVEQNVQRFRTIYFSDTILLYQETTGFRLERFFDLCFAANVILTSLLSNEIPASGAIAFGPFTVRTEQESGHRVYFGPPLVESYDVVKAEKWVGTVVCPSAANRLREERVKDLEADDLWRLRVTNSDRTLLLNPFQPIMEHFKRAVSKKVAPNPDALILRAPLKALAFLSQYAAALHKSGNYTSSVSARYQNTLGFARSVLPNGCFEWAVSAVDEMKPYKSLLSAVRASINEKNTKGA